MQGEVVHPEATALSSSLSSSLLAARRDRRALLRVALIVAAYLVAFIVLDLLARAFEELPGVVAWYPPAGLSFALVLVFGWRFAPVVGAASLISSLLILRLPQPVVAIVVWALVMPFIYGLAATVLRRQVRFDWHLREMRDVTGLVFATVFVAALLAVISVLGSALGGVVPRDQVLNSIGRWWMGETVGILTIAPFLLVYVMPWLKGFAEGHPVPWFARRSFSRPSTSAIGQAASLVLVLYWVFGTRAPEDFRPLNLIAVPLIWIALARGFKAVTAAILTLNLGVMLAIWVVGFDPARVRELTLLRIVSCVVALVLGAVVTGRRQAEMALQKRETTFRSLIENAGDLIVVLDADGTSTYVSPSVEQTLGFKPDEIVGRNISNFIHPDDLSAGLAAIATRLQDRPVEVTTELRVRHRDGSFRTIEAVGNRLVDDPTVNRIVINARDITERVEADRENEKLESQLHQAQKMEAVGRLAGGVAHDFNNMLGVILGHTEMAIEHVDPAQPLYADLTEIKKAAERSVNLTSQLLAFARKQTMAPKVLDLNETVSGMLSMLERLIGEDIVLSWYPAVDLWAVKVDPSQIDQILVNLCVNARDAIADVGRITIETGNSSFDQEYCAAHPDLVPGEFVRISVSDDGCGMDQETVSRLFEPFFTTKSEGKGTGLGLATVYGIVKQNEGFINVYTEPGRGTTFAVYLARHAARTESIKIERATAPIAGGQETILVVEDESAILTLITRMLQRHGYTVLTAGTPSEAMRLAREHVGMLHLLMTDVIMPEMNGRDLANNLLALHPELKRLFMSGYTADVIAHHGVLDEGVHFIQKPFSMKDLANTVRGVLDSE